MKKIVRQLILGMVLFQGNKAASGRAQPVTPNRSSQPGIARETSIHLGKSTGRVSFLEPADHTYTPGSSPVAKEPIYSLPVKSAKTVTPPPLPPKMQVTSVPSVTTGSSSPLKRQNAFRRTSSSSAVTKNESGQQPTVPAATATASSGFVSKLQSFFNTVTGKDKKSANLTQPNKVEKLPDTSSVKRTESVKKEPVVETSPSSVKAPEIVNEKLVDKPKFEQPSKDSTFGFEKEYDTSTRVPEPVTKETVSTAVPEKRVETLEGVANRLKEALADRTGVVTQPALEKGPLKPRRPAPSAPTSEPVSVNSALAPRKPQIAPKPAVASKPVLAEPSTSPSPAQVAQEIKDTYKAAGDFQTIRDQLAKTPESPLRSELIKAHDKLYDAYQEKMIKLPELVANNKNVIPEQTLQDVKPYITVAESMKAELVKAQMPLSEKVNKPVEQVSQPSSLQTVEQSSAIPPAPALPSFLNRVDQTSSIPVAPPMPGFLEALAGKNPNRAAAVGIPITGRNSLTVRRNGGRSQSFSEGSVVNESLSAKIPEASAAPIRPRSLSLDALQQSSRGASLKQSAKGASLKKVSPKPETKLDALKRANGIDSGTTGSPLFMSDSVASTPSYRPEASSVVSQNVQLPRPSTNTALLKQIEAGSQLRKVPAELLKRPEWTQESSSFANAVNNASKVQPKTVKKELDFDQDFGE